MNRLNHHLVLVPLFVFLCAFAEAQGLETTLIMNPQPSPYMSDWQSHRETAQVLVLNSGTNTRLVRFNTRVYRDGQLKAATKFNSMPVLSIPPGGMTFTCENIIPFSAVDFYGDDKNTLLQTGKLPSSNYQICIAFDDAETGQRLTPDQCKGFQIVSYQPPVLIQPTASATYNCNQVSSILFRWTPISPLSTSLNVYYEVNLFEVLPGQTAMQAFRSNEPIMQERVGPASNCQLQFPTDVDISSLFSHFGTSTDPVITRTFVWNVRTMDAFRNVPVTDGDGWSEPQTFSISCPNSSSTTTFDGVCGCKGQVQSIEVAANSNPFSDYVGGPYFLEHGQSSNSANAQSALNFWLTFSVNCVMPCKHGIQCTWTLSFTDDQGHNTVTTAKDVLGTSFVPPTAGTLELRCSGTVMCGNSTCSPFSLSRTLVIQGSGSVNNPDHGSPTTKDSVDLTTGHPHGGETTNPPGTTDREKCGCACTCSATITKTKADAHGCVLIGKPGGNCTLVPCPGSTTETVVACTAQISTSWTLTSGSDVVEMIPNKQDPLQVSIRCKQPGFYGVIFTVDVVCSDGHQCRCIAEFEDFCPGIDTLRSYCFDPNHASEKGSPISLGSAIESPQEFPYPRAVPIRASGIDYDLGVIRCLPCQNGKQSFIKTPVKDGLQYHWVLNGKGSLNTMPDLTKAAVVQREIDSLLRRLADEQRVLDSLESYKADLPKRVDEQREEAKKQKKPIDAEVDSLTRTMKTVNDSSETLRKRQVASEQTLADLKTLVRTTTQNIQSLRKSLDSINQILQGKPAPQEVQLLQDIQTQQSLVRDALRKRDADQQKLNDKSGDYQKQLDAALKDLEMAQALYETQRTQSSSAAQSIGQFQTQLYPDGPTRDYFRWQKDFDNKSGAWITQCGNGNPSLLSSLASVHALADSSLSTANTQLRTSLGLQFESQLNALLVEFSAVVASIRDSVQRTQCASSMSVLTSSGENYRTNHSTIRATNFVLDKTLQRKVMVAAALIRSRAAQLKGASDAVKTKAAAYADVVDRMKSELSNLSATLQQDASEAQKQDDKLSEMQQRLKDLVDQRESALQRNRTSLFDQSQALNRAKLEADSTVRSSIDSMTTLNNALIAWKATRMALATETAAINARLSLLAISQQALQAIIDQDVSARLKAIDASIAATKKRIEQIEKALAKKRDEHASLLQGKKSADGALVYYVPPPLEQIMTADQAKEFETRKDSVNAAETQVTEALNRKQAVQKQLFNLLEQVSSGLLRYRDAQDAQTAAEKKSADLAREQAATKNEGKKNLADQQSVAQKAETDASGEVDSQKDNLKKYQDKADNLQKQVDEQAQKVEDAKSALKTAGDSFKDKKAQLDREKELQANAEQTQRDRAAELDKANEEYKEKKNESGRAQSALNHAIAANDEAAASTARAEVQARQADEQLAKTKVEQSEQQLASAASSVQSAALRVQNATTSLDDAKKSFGEKSQAKIAAIDQLTELNDRMSRDVGPRLLDAKQKLQQAEETLEKKKDERKQLNDDINKGLDSLDEVKKLQKQVDDAKAAAENAKSTAAEAKASVNDALTAKDTIAAHASQELTEAKQKLAKAKDELHTFLLGIFNHIESTLLNNELITITATDLVVDSWRAHDDPVSEVKPFRYLGRLPQFAGTVPKSAVGGDTAVGECPLHHSFLPDAGINGATDPSLSMKEPRTLALLYKDGEALWKEWAVIPPTTNEVLARDYSILSGFAADNDLSLDICGPSAQGCQEKKNTLGIVDLPNYQWQTEGESILGTTFKDVVWKAPEVAPQDCRKPTRHKVTYSANDIAPDPTVEKKGGPDIKAGVLIEVTKELNGCPNSADTVIARVVCGDHKGLSGESIEIRVKPSKGYEKIAKDFGLEHSNTLQVTKQTDADGYVHVPFYYGSAYAQFDLQVEWRRSSCGQDSLIARTPLYLQFLRFADGTPQVVFDAAKKLWSGAASFDAAVASLPAHADDPANDSTYKKLCEAAVGLVDNNRDSANGVMIRFLPSGKPVLQFKPDNVATEGFGYARTVVSGLPKNDKTPVFASAQCDEQLMRALCTPKKVDAQKSGKLKRFKIGDTKLPFLVELEQPASANEIVYGKGKLIIERAQEFLQSFIDVQLSVNGVILNDATDPPVARSGFVTWKPTPAKSIDYKGFHFDVDSLSITAAIGAKIGGRVQQEKYLPDAAGFFAELESSGDFFGTVSDLPEISFAKCTLKKGSTFTLDMHATKDEDGIDDALKPFVGIVINKATLILPPTFSTIHGKDTTASELSVENFAIGRKAGGGSVAIGGSVKVSGTFFSMGFGGWSCNATSLEFAFVNSEIKSGAINGTVRMPMPFEGSLDAKISGSKEEWSATISTANPVSVPKIKTVFSILDGTSLRYKPATSLVELTLNATATCEYFKRMDIKDLTINNEGTIVGEVSILNPNIQFGRGFDLNVSEISIKKEGGSDLSVNVKGEFSIPHIIALKGGVLMTTGPTVAVSLDEASFKFDYGPCSFDGSLAFSSTEFRGDFDIGIKNLIPNGISAKLVAGVQPIDQLHSFTYWYAEMSVGLSIPLGQTGLFVTKLGGGVGYNYEPPIGAQPGNPKQLPNSLAFKAIVGIGTPANGSVMNSRVEMVLIPWTTFSLYGKVWLLNKDDALFGEGQLNLRTEPPQVDGYVRMFVGLPNAEGKILRFDGKVGFLYSSTQQYIRSEKLSGVALEVIKADGVIDVDKEHVLLDGTLRYDFDKKLPLGIVDFYVSLHAFANGNFTYTNASSSLGASVSFKGSVDVKGDFPLYGMTTLLSGAADIGASLKASPAQLRIDAKVHVSYSVFGYSDALDLDVGYQS